MERSATSPQIQMLNLEQSNSRSHNNNTKDKHKIGKLLMKQEMSNRKDSSVTYVKPPYRPGTPDVPAPISKLLTRSAPLQIKNKNAKVLTVDEETEHETQPQPQQVDQNEEYYRTLKAICLSWGNGASPPKNGVILRNFVGSFQESLLSNHMANIPFTLHEGFQLEIGIHTNEKAFAFAPHLKLDFSAQYYHVDWRGETPYCATIDLDKIGYKVPAKATLQITIKNPSKMPIKTLQVKYDLSEMPDETKTILRQKIMTSKGILQYAVHLKFLHTMPTKYYLYKSVRLIFAPRLPDDFEKLITIYDLPEPRFWKWNRKHGKSNSANLVVELRKSNNLPNNSLQQQPQTTQTQQQQQQQS